MPYSVSDRKFPKTAVVQAISVEPRRPTIAELTNSIIRKHVIPKLVFQDKFSCAILKHLLLLIKFTLYFLFK